MFIYLELVPLKWQDQSLTYSVDKKKLANNPIGCVATISIKNKNYKAIIINIKKEKPSFKCKEILDISFNALISREQFLIAKDVSKKSLYSFEKIIKNFVPKFLIEGFELKNTEKIIQLIKTPEEKIKGKKMLELINFLQKEREIKLDLAKKELKISNTTINNLISKNTIKVIEKNIKYENNLKKIKTITLNLEQQNTVNEILKNSASLLFANYKFGKTHLLKFLASFYLKKGESSLFVLSEKLITMDFINQCKSDFGEENIVFFHGDLNDSEKRNQYFKAKYKSPKIFIGTKSILFLPFHNLKFIIMEEEHDLSFKFLNSPKLHTREIINTFANIYNARLVFSSATPSLELFNQSKNQQIKLINKNKKVEDNIKIIDLKEEPLLKENNNFSSIVFNDLKNKIKNQQKSIIFFNRTGIYRALICADCGEYFRCKKSNCNLSLVKNKKNNQLLHCRYSGEFYNIPTKCDKCGSKNLMFTNSGTSQIFEFLKNQFPKKNIIQVDGEQIVNKKNTNYISSNIKNADILIGTKIISKNFNFDTYSTIYFLNIDIGLGVPDFRSQEITLQNIYQTAGRIKHQKEIFIQTLAKNSNIINFIKNGNYENFINYETSIRKQFFLPPFSNILKITLKNRDQNKLKNHSKNIKYLINKYIKEKNKKISIFDKSISTTKEGNLYTLNIILITRNPLEIINDLALFNINIEINPVSML